MDKTSWTKYKYGQDFLDKIQIWTENTNMDKTSWTKCNYGQDFLDHIQIWTRLLGHKVIQLYVQERVTHYK